MRPAAAEDGTNLDMGRLRKEVENPDPGQPIGAEQGLEVARQCRRVAGDIDDALGFQPNDLIGRLRTDIAFADLDFAKVLDPAAYVGRAPQQVDEFVRAVVNPIRKKYRDELNRKVELKV